MPPLVVVGRLVQSLDFERVLGHRSNSQSEHFAVHHLAGRPSLNARAQRARVARELSTDGAPSADSPVDKLLETMPASSGVPTLWLGAVVPKRHAKRAVTRSLLKRQIRESMRRHAGDLPVGLWVVRLRSPFDRARFPSAASDALKHAARSELDAVFADVVRRAGVAPTSR